MRRFLGFFSLAVATACLPFVSPAQAMPGDPAPPPYTTADAGHHRQDGARPPIALRVDATAGRHRISEDIYGISMVDDSLAAKLDVPVDRWGGTSTETYNWQVRGANQGADKYFENVADCMGMVFENCGSGRDFSMADQIIWDSRNLGAKALLTLPMLGWVARSVNYTWTDVCSYPADVFDPQDSHDRDNPACGNGKRDGQWITSPAVDPNLAGTPAGPDFAAAWIHDLISRFGTATTGGVQIYGLGNEPGRWNTAHHDFHPQPLTYDELWQKSSDLAHVVKYADPDAQVLGPSEWGWPNYFCSTADLEGGHCTPASPDRAAHGGLDISSWYLRQFAKYEKQTGERLLDYFDLHFYPRARYAQHPTDVTRALWDPGYRDPSWDGARVQLLTRMHRWVRANYPGTKLAISEYNLSRGITTSDRRLQNVIEADTLGIFGREGLDLATYSGTSYWRVPDGAFRIFRNYDRRHHGFGDHGVSATSSDQRRVSVYAARQGASGPMTIVVVNKTTTRLRTRLTLSHFAHAGTARVYQYTGENVGKRGPIRVSTDGFTRSYPRRSVTLVVVKPS